jgi:hypothetical protein
MRGSSGVFELILGRLLLPGILTAALFLPVHSEASTDIDDQLREGAMIYMNPDVETYEPVSRKTLPFSTQCIVRGVPASVTDYIELQAEQAPYGPFDDTRVRVAVLTSSGRLIFVDADGGISIPDKGTSKQLNPAEFDRFKGKIRRLEQAWNNGKCQGRWSANPEKSTESELPVSAQSDHE